MSTKSNEQPQENSSFCSQSAIEKSTDLTFNASSKKRQTEEKSYLSAPSIQFFTHSTKKNLLNHGGEKKQPAEQEDDIIPLLQTEKMSSEIYSRHKANSWVIACQRTWIMNRIGRPIAYIFIDVNAEAWVAETDKRREEIIKNNVVQGKWNFYIYDTLWTLDFIIHAIGKRIKLFF